MKLIQFSAENGSTKAGKVIRPIKAKLNQILFNDEGGAPEFKTIEGLSIVFRLCGANKNFSGEGPQMLEKSRGRNFLTIDFVIPEAEWGKPTESFLVYLINGVNDCARLLIEEMERIGEIPNGDLLFKHYSQVIKRIGN